MTSVDFNSLHTGAVTDMMDNLVQRQYYPENHGSEERLVQHAQKLSVMFCSLRSSNSEQDEDTQDDRQKLIKDKPVHSKKSETSQLVQEEKAETGNVRDNILRVDISSIKVMWLQLNVFRKLNSNFTVFTNFKDDTNNNIGTHFRHSTQ